MKLNRIAILLSLVGVFFFLASSKSAAETREEIERDVAAKATHKPGNDGLGDFTPRPLGTSPNAAERPFVDLYNEYERTNHQNKGPYLATMRARAQDILVQRVGKDFSSVIGNKLEWAIIYAEGVNNHPAFGAPAEVGHRHAASALAELIGSLPASPDPRNPAKSVKDMRDRIERELMGHRDASDRGKREKEYLRLLLKALDESIKVIENPDYKPPTGNDDDSAFRREVGKAMQLKQARTKNEKALIKELDKFAQGKGDAEALKKLGFDNFKDARDALVAKSPGTLLTYASGLRKTDPETAASLIRALIGDQRDGKGNFQLTFWNRHDGKQENVSFGNGSKEDVAATLQRWEDRYNHQDFTLKKPEVQPKTDALVTGTPHTGQPQPVSGQPVQPGRPGVQPPGAGPQGAQGQQGPAGPRGVVPPRQGQGGAPGARPNFARFVRQVPRLLYYPDVRRGTSGGAAGSADTKAVLDNCKICHSENDLKTWLTAGPIPANMPQNNIAIPDERQKEELREWARGNLQL